MPGGGGVCCLRIALQDTLTRRGAASHHCQGVDRVSTHPPHPGLGTADTDIVSIGCWRIQREHRGSSIFRDVDAFVALLEEGHLPVGVDADEARHAYLQPSRMPHYRLRRHESLVGCFGYTRAGRIVFDGSALDVGEIVGNRGAALPRQFGRRCSPVST